MPPRSPLNFARMAAALLVGVLALHATEPHGDTGQDAEPLVLWAGGAGPGRAEQWRPLGAYPDAETCEAARRDALQAAWKGLREMGVLELVPDGHAGFTRVDPRTLETYTFRFGCRPGSAPLVISIP